MLDTEYSYLLITT